MTRTALPSRRVALSVPARHGDFAFGLTIGFDLTGAALEVFADGAKYGSDRAHVLADACVLISLLLQHGAGVGCIANSLGAVPDHAGELRPASVIGAILAALAQVQVDMGAGVSA